MESNSADIDRDWKKGIGFPINYDSGQSSEDDFDAKDVVMRHPRQSAGYLLADEGDGAAADLLGSTPPRARIRDKEKRRTVMDTESLSRVLRDSKRNSSDNFCIPQQPAAPERLKKRASLKLIRSRERDWKQDLGQRENKADSLPSPNPVAAIPTLVESCSRFMSLSSRLKCRDSVCPEQPSQEVEERWPRGDRDEDLPPNRVTFHKTFSMLINMGNIDKSCRRAVHLQLSREEQVWQNELKDLIWLELQAKLAGRTLAQQDAFLCAQRNIVPTLVQNIIDYRFVNQNPCRGRSRRLCVIKGSREDLSSDQLEGKDDSGMEQEGCDDDGVVSGCVSFDCRQCSEAIGKAMREVGTLLDSFYNAVSLYPSSQAMTVEHPLVATQLFKNRIKAMCLWYNIALHLRLKVVAVRRLLRSLRLKGQRRGLNHLASTDSDISRQSSECQRPCQVRFNISNNPTDSSNSDSSSQSDGHKDEIERNPESDASQEQGKRQSDSEGCTEGHGEDEVDSGIGKSREHNGATTPEIVISDSTHGTTDTTMSSESGYTSNLERECVQAQREDDIYDVGSLEELTMLRLLDKCKVSPYRNYHYEMLKTQGVRRCMMFVNKMRKNVLHKVYLTMERPDTEEPETYAEDDPVEVFVDTKDEEDKPDSAHDEDAMKTYELRRFGCWSEECLAMRLPSYRSHFLLLCSICMEAVHDYLSLRLEGRPEQPSCLTVKQLIHELKEGLDIATDMRAAFARNVEVALAGQAAGAAAKHDLLQVVRAFDATVEDVLKQYLSYLTTMSEVEHMPRSQLEHEWAFTARLAKRTKCAALLAPVAFTDIACNQIGRLLKQFQSKFEKLSEVETKSPDNTRYIVYSLCREAQGVYAGEREATLQAAQWARALAARLARAPPPAFRPQRARIFNSLMCIRDCIVSHTELILERSRVAYSDELPRELTEGVIGRVRELLLQVYKLGFEVHKELHRFVNDSSLNRGLCGPRRSINSSPPKGGRPRFMRSESIGEDCETSVFDDKLFDHLNNFGENNTQSSIELLLTDEQPQEPVEIRQSPATAESKISAEERQWAARVSRAVIQFARCWMQFVMERCDRGRGLRPRWASQGLEFLMLACDPYNTRHLSEEEFEELKKQMDECISHVIGSRPSGPRPPDLAASPTPTRPHRHRIHSPMSSFSTNTASKDVPPPPTPPSEPDPLLSFHGVEPTVHNRHVIDAIERLDQERDAKLRETKTVGRVLEAAVTSYEPKLRQVTFKWQRGLKIGAGTFGKVYTVVNTESGQLLAMKELSIGAGDRRALQRAANELRVLEGVIHPHLVRYYGCEVHREEMLIFMELCVEGSLEALLATNGALSEHTVRRYTKQLVSALLALHERSIAHRDVKSGNIFLTNEGHCLKLGDFGCAVKIRANTTAAGELQGCVGTQAYMAPEVFMKSSGHGRAADIWSLGCVVTEMASGKRPFSEYDSNYQIMFVVGMGGRPHIPPTLSEEGRQFCVSCLTHDPDQRPKAEALTLHHFLMVKSDEDCNCEPGFLIT